MAEIHDKKAMLYQNLTDAGLSTESAAEYISLYEEGQREKMLRFLKEYRKNLLSIVRKQQKQIDCLDFLMYRVEKDVYENGGNDYE